MGGVWSFPVSDMPPILSTHPWASLLYVMAEWRDELSTRVKRRGAGSADAPHSLVQGQAKGAAGVSQAPAAHLLRAPLPCARHYAKFFTARFSRNSYNKLLIVECYFLVPMGKLRLRGYSTRQIFLTLSLYLGFGALQLNI